MKIALLALTGGGFSGGFRKYLERLVPLLREEPDVERVDIFLPPQVAQPDDLTWPMRDELRGFSGLRERVAALEPDVIFIPTSRVLRVGSIPVVTMVRNMEPLEVPFGGNTLKEGVKNIGRALAAYAACRRSTRVIAVSNHVRDVLVRRWKIDDARIGVVTHGIDPMAPAPPPMPAVAAPVANERFLFTAGSVRPARGLEDVITALAELPRDVRLLIAGTVDRGAEHYAAAMRDLANRLNVADRIVWAGHLDAAGMSWCFRNAAAFVMTSRAEACPNVVLEALTHGAMSVSTDHAPMPEFFGDAATYYDERNAAVLAARIREALSADSDARSRTASRAMERAGLFRWPDTARATVHELRTAMGG